VACGTGGHVDERQLAHAGIGLAKLEPSALGEPDQPLARAVEQLGVGGEGHCFGLHHGVDDYARQVLGLHRLRPGRHRQALLEERLSSSLPMRWRQCVSDERSREADAGRTPRRKSGVSA
jgi:hypothetical protein